MIHVYGVADYCLNDIFRKVSGLARLWDTVDDNLERSEIAFNYQLLTRIFNCLLFVEHWSFWRPRVFVILSLNSSVNAINLPEWYTSFRFGLLRIIRVLWRNVSPFGLFEF